MSDFQVALNPGLQAIHPNSLELKVEPVFTASAFIHPKAQLDGNAEMVIPKEVLNWEVDVSKHSIDFSEDTLEKVSDVDTEKDT